MYIIPLGQQKAHHICVMLICRHMQGSVALQGTLPELGTVSTISAELTV